jgi:small GTP-binding protein
VAHLRRVPHSLKITFIGADGVGKSKLIDAFLGERPSTEIQLEDLRTVNTFLPEWQYAITFWDILGRDRYLSQSEDFFLGAHAIVLVYSVNSSATFMDAIYLREGLRGLVPRVPLILIANKIDLSAVVPYEEAFGWAQTNNADFCLTSAKTGDGISETFDLIVDVAIHYQQRLMTEQKK